MTKVDRRTTTQYQSYYHDKTNGNDADHQSLLLIGRLIGPANCRNHMKGPGEISGQLLGTRQTQTEPCGNDAYRLTSAVVIPVL
jgi:hypothetical protein